MNTIRHLFMILLLAAMTCPVFSKGRVTLMVGDTQFQSRGVDKWVPLTVGQQVDTGDSIRTGDDSYAEFESGNGLIRINANSKVRISKSMIQEKETDSISMFFGSIFLKISKLGKDDENKGYAVETPSAFCAVRGTEFTVASGYDGQTLVQVEKGSVALSGDEGEVLIGENQESEVSLGGAPTGVTRIKKRAWHEWIRKSREGMKGKEIAVLRGAMRRMIKLQRDIEILEGLNRKFTKEKDDLMAKALEYQTAGDLNNYREYTARSHRAKRAAYVALNAVYYKAEKLDLIRNLAAEAYAALPSKKGEAEDASRKIDEIFNRNYERYIREIRSGDSMRQKILEKRKNKKTQSE